MIYFAWFPVFFLLPVPLLMRNGAGERENSAAVIVPFFDQMREEFGTRGKKRRRNRTFLLWILWILLVTAAARPQISGNIQEYTVPVRDIVLILDISHSMTQKDMDENRKTRLDIVKEAASSFVDFRKNDRLGIILFSEQASLYVPLTVDPSALHKMLDGVQSGLLGSLTSIGDALGLALKYLENSQAIHKVIVLLTDGINNAGNIPPEDALELARQKEVKVYTIGVGTDFNQDAALDTEFLEKAASETGGLFFVAKDAQAVFDAYQDIARNEPSSETDVFLVPRKEMYFLPLSVFALIVSLTVFKRLVERIVFAVKGKSGWK